MRNQLRRCRSYSASLHFPRLWQKAFVCCLDGDVISGLRYRLPVILAEIDQPRRLSILQLEAKSWSRATWCASQLIL